MAKQKALSLNCYYCTIERN